MPTLQMDRHARADALLEGEIALRAEIARLQALAHLPACAALLTHLSSALLTLQAMREETQKEAQG